MIGLELLVLGVRIEFVRVASGGETGLRETGEGEGTRDEQVELSVLAGFLVVMEGVGKPRDVDNGNRVGTGGGECSGDDNGEECEDIVCLLAFFVGTLNQPSSRRRMLIKVNDGSSNCKLQLD